VSRRLLSLAVVTLVFAALSDPADRIFHIKVPAFVAVILVWLYRRGPTGRTLTKQLWAITLCLAILVPLLWTVIGILNQSAHSGDSEFALLKSFLFLLMLPVLVTEDIDLVSLIVRMSILIAGLTLVMGAVNFLSPALFLILYNFSIDKQNAIISSSRDLFGIGLGMFYYKTSPLMIFPFSYYCCRLFQREVRLWLPLFMCMLYGTALLVSGTRANVLGALFVAGAFALRRIRRAGGWLPTLAVATLSLILMAAFVVPKFADTQESGNATKLSHLRSYENEFDSRPSALLWGEGANRAFYSEGFQDWTTVTELSYLELVRVFGLPVTILFVAGLLWIGYALFASGALPAAFAYVAYLGISGSNPLLVSSTGLLVICAVWKEAVRKSSPESAFHLPGFDVHGENSGARVKARILSPESLS